jgi:hypothetical protein
MSIFTHLLALWVGVCVGFGLFAILAAGRRADDAADGAARAVEADREWLKHATRTRSRGPG